MVTRNSPQQLSFLILSPVVFLSFFKNHHLVLLPPFQELCKNCSLCCHCSSLVKEVVFVDLLPLPSWLFFSVHYSVVQLWSSYECWLFLDVKEIGQHRKEQLNPDYAVGRDQLTIQMNRTTVSLCLLDWTWKDTQGLKEGVISLQTDQRFSAKKCRLKEKSRRWESFGLSDRLNFKKQSLDRKLPKMRKRMKNKHKV